MHVRFPLVVAVAAALELATSIVHAAEPHVVSTSPARLAFAAPTISTSSRR